MKTSSKKNVIFRLIQLLERPERLLVLSSFFIRLSLVALDIFGLALVGVAVSLISGGTIGPESMTGKAINFVESMGAVNVYAIFGLASVVFFAIKGLLSLALNSWLLRTVAVIESSKSTKMFSRVSRGSLDKLQKFGKKDLGIALVDSLDMSLSKLIMSLSVLFGEATLMMVIGIYLAVLNFPLLLVMVAYFSILGAIMQFLVAKRTRDTARDMQKASTIVNSSVLDLFDNFRQLRSLGKTDVVVTKFKQARSTIANGTSTMSMLSVMPRYITEIALMLAFSLLLLQRSLAPDVFDATTLAIFVAGSFRIIASLLPFQGSLALLKQIAGSSELALELLKEYPADIEIRRKVSNKSPKGLEIDFIKASFRYVGGKRNVLNDCTLRIKPGEYIAITGKSGSGKSTLADLILGLREPTSGQVHVNGEPATSFVSANPGAIGYVPQNCAIFEGTIEFNVALESSLNEEKKQRVTSAIAAAGLAGWIEELDDGVETKLGGTQRELSGGQLQRIGIARVLYSQPSVLVLDESTSALDPQTEIEILDTLDRLGGAVTVIAIAHKGAVVERAQRGLHLSAGKVSERRIG